MRIIYKNQTPKTSRLGWALLRGGQMYQAHMGKSYADGVLC